MYNLIFVYFYYLSSKRNPNPRFVGLTFVAVSALFHFAFFLGILKFLFDFILPRFDERYFFNKLYLIPFIALWLFAFELIYNKRRVKRILNNFGVHSDIVNLKNTVVVLLVIIVPLLIGIYLFNYS